MEILQEAIPYIQPRDIDKLLAARTPQRLLRAIEESHI
jgi:hypothetical protein